MTDDAFYAHLWFLCPGIGHGRLASLRKTFGSFQTAWQADKESLQAWGQAAFRGGARSLEQAMAMKASLSAEKECLSLQKNGIWMVVQGSAGYPPELLHLHDPPEIVYGKGKLDLLLPRIAMVGARHPSSYGIFVAQRLASELAQAGIQVVSGLARGIDTSSHIGALKGGGTTLAVLGSGLNAMYPKENETLASQIAANGCLLSEVLPDTAPAKGLFPMRNRLIAALSRGIVVVEAGMKSGSMSTVEAALQMGREVFAVPGPIYEVLSQGPNRLIQEGAKLITSAEDVLSEFSSLSEAQEFADNAAVRNLPPSMKLVWESLAAGPVHVSNLVVGLKLSGEVLIPLLLEMAMRGIVEQLPGSFWTRNTGRIG